MRLRKLSAIFSMVIGICMIAMWAMLLITGQVVELSTRPTDITFHLTAESLTALCLIVSGYGLIKRYYWATKFYLFSMGMLLYSLSVVNGYYSQMRSIPMTIMFSIFTVITIFLSIIALSSKSK